MQLIFGIKSHDLAWNLAFPPQGLICLPAFTRSRLPPRPWADIMLDIESRVHKSRVHKAMLLQALGFA